MDRLRCTIIPGVQIGHGSIIATCSVITRDVEPYAIVGGNPAAPIGYRFDEATRDTLLDIAWWDWDADRITRNVQAICSNDLKALQEAV